MPSARPCTPARVSSHQTMDIPSYEPAAALDFFKAGGEVETIPAGRTIFRESLRSRRTLFAIGIAVFGVGSVLAALSTDPGQLIAARALRQNAA